MICTPCDNGVHHLCTKGPCRCIADEMEAMSPEALAKLARDVWPGRRRPERN